MTSDINFFDNIYIQNQRPDTFVYTTADHTGFLLPQAGAYFVVGYSGINTFYRIQIEIGIYLIQIKKEIYFGLIR